MFAAVAALRPRQAALDVLLAGSGCGGSLLAWILASHGMHVALFDPQPHPRFAIGESSTPIADMILADIARRYELTALAPLAQYGTWCEVYPQLRRGRKRGFSYFFHTRCQPFVPQPNHATELLVAASSDDYHCDTHWYRADVDSFLAQCAQEAGATLLAPAKVLQCDYRHQRWQVVLQLPDGRETLEARFLVDASGGQFGRKFLHAGDHTESLKTHSGAMYSHLARVLPWKELLARGAFTGDDYPFDCDAAALHHVFDGGWMWQLRFDHQVTSVGLAWSRGLASLAGSSPEEKFYQTIHHFPSIAAQLQEAQVVDPPGRWYCVERLQRCNARAVGKAWAALPHAFAFIDPLHSTGIAHTLSGVERLAEMLLGNRNAVLQAELWENYQWQLLQEVKLIDELISAAYATSGQFPRFIAATMLYFAAAVHYETRRRQGFRDAFLCADDPELSSRISEACRYLRDQAVENPVLDDQGITQDWGCIRAWIEPYNTIGLLDVTRSNMYPHTAAR